MSEIRDGDAINVIVRHAIHTAVSDGGTCPEWEDYPEIGENDWYEIEAEIALSTDCPSPAAFDAAYAFLAARADHDA